ncbi:MAG: hypothetical protein WAM82_07090 [Thermoanaerobaculia bacterium]
MSVLPMDLSIGRKCVSIVEKYVSIEPMCVSIEPMCVSIEPMCVPIEPIDASIPRMDLSTLRKSAFNGALDAPIEALNRRAMAPGRIRHRTYELYCPKCASGSASSSLAR